MHPFTDKFSSARRHFLDKPKNRRAWLFVALLLPIFILLISTSAPKHYVSIRRLTQRSPGVNGLCKHGTVYVYDLPPEFNQRLLDNCDDVDPGNSYCYPLSNDGFGPRNTDLVGLIPKDLAPAWYSTNMFTSEVLFHKRVLNYKCRTSDPKSATAFYVPVYAGLGVTKYLYGNYTASERDEQFLRLLRWVTNQPSWKRSKGADHFIVLGRISWDFRRESDEKCGSSFLFMAPMRQTLRLSMILELEGGGGEKKKELIAKKD